MSNRVMVLLWTDAVGSDPSSGWIDRPEPEIFAGNCLSAGLVVGETSLSYLLAGSVDGEGNVLATHEIPKAMVHRLLMDEEF